MSLGVQGFSAQPSANDFALAQIRNKAQAYAGGAAGGATTGEAGTVNAASIGGNLLGWVDTPVGVPPLAQPNAQPSDLVSSLQNGASRLWNWLTGWMKPNPNVQQPVYPTQPTYPTAPVYPTQPTYPTTPVYTAPSAPTYPTAPAYPAPAPLPVPTAPIYTPPAPLPVPTAPTYTVPPQPTYPAQPTYPTYPTQPAYPTYPGQPTYTAPAYPPPVQPTYPTYPTQPTYPVYPAQPTYPTYPANPYNDPGFQQLLQIQQMIDQMQAQLAALQAAAAPATPGKPANNPNKPGQPVNPSAKPKPAPKPAPSQDDKWAERLKNMKPDELAKLGANNKQAFFNVLRPAAEAAEKKYGVPAAVILAQAALETGWGSHLAAAYNLFGHKGSGPAGTSTARTREVYNGKSVYIDAGFAKYHNYFEGVEYHGKRYHNGYYDKAVNNYAKYHDPDRFARDITGIYATDPSYGTKLIQIMNQYGLKK